MVVFSLLMILPLGIAFGIRNLAFGELLEFIL